MSEIKVVNPCPPPEDCQEYPETRDKDLLRKYYRHNLSKWVPPDLLVPAEVLHFIVHYIEDGYSVGDRIEVNDALWTKRWYVCIVRDVKPKELFVHYDGWSDKWDEWVQTDAEAGRIAPLLTHTDGHDNGKGGKSSKKGCVQRKRCIRKFKPTR
eukprot:TRINITY_DN22155_c0_g1_i1.p1 TRINITY_DN22155_c0_g1~~TRINITY_DN22155_c0_g1_i1.p1  ORF type:complete len:154 (+),score=33.59 TRINITY_DN22155_c0_g1_i1:3-464(+)